MLVSKAAAQPRPRGSDRAIVQNRPYQCVRSASARVAMCSCSCRLLGGDESRIVSPYSVVVRRNCIATDGALSAGISRALPPDLDCADESAKMGAAWA